jgi:hypothetical protein
MLIIRGGACKHWIYESEILQIFGAVFAGLFRPNIERNVKNLYKYGIYVEEYADDFTQLIE